MKTKSNNELVKLDFWKKNVAVCTKIVTNAIYCLKHLLSSADFFQLNEGKLTSNNTYATKNDGP